jgi:hypothetical protein
MALASPDLLRSSRHYLALNQKTDVSHPPLRRLLFAYQGAPLRQVKPAVNSRRILKRR